MWQSNILIGEKGIYMNLLLLKQVIEWWQSVDDYLEIINVQEANKAFYFTVDISGREYDVSIKDASLRT